jgi:exodeoxyribonuclease-1
MAFSLLWYDLETFGTNPQWDRIAQFAAIRTDGEFREVEPPVTAYCRLTPDYVPHPDACLVTGITPGEVNDSGVSERELAALIHEHTIRPGTCTVGFNNLRFDDEFVRALFYRNFYDPYRREYADGNSRWDIIDLVRMCHDLRPDGIEWVRDADGKPVFALTDLTAANHLEHDHAHDAQSDVRATIALARLVHEKQPKLFRYYYSLRKKDEVRRLLNLREMKPIVHSSSMFTTTRGCTSIVLPLSVAPDNPNLVITCDLRQDPDEWLDLGVEEIRRRVFTSREELGGEPRVWLKGIQINRSPAIAPLSTLEPERAQALGIDTEACLRNAERIRGRHDVVQRIRSVYAGPARAVPTDVDLQIYSGDFFPDEDRVNFDVIRSAEPASLLATPPHLHDSRGPEMLWRYVARNHSEALSEEDHTRWKSFCASRLLTPEPSSAIDIGTFVRDVKNRLSRTDTPARDKLILKDLLEYGKELERSVLS